MERDKPPFSVGIDIQNIQALQASSTPHSPRMQNKIVDPPRGEAPHQEGLTNEMCSSPAERGAAQLGMCYDSHKTKDPTFARRHLHQKGL